MTTKMMSKPKYLSFYDKSLLRQKNYRQAIWKHMLRLACCQVLLLLWLAASCYAQPTDGRWQQIKEARKLYIKERLQLGNHQEKQFLQDYDAYLDQRQALARQRQRINREKPGPASPDSVLLHRLETMWQLRRHEVELDESYYQRFRAYLRPYQLLELYRLEQEFFRWMFSYLRERKK